MSEDVHDLEGPCGLCGLDHSFSPLAKADEKAAKKAAKAAAKQAEAEAEEAEPEA